MSCTVCGGKTDAYLCRRCCAEIERALAELPADLADLQAVATRQAAGPLGLGDPARQWDGAHAAGSLGDAGWVFAPAAADQLWVVGNTVSTWARHLAESRGAALPAATRGAWTTRHKLYIVRNRAQLRVERVFIPAAEQPVTDLVYWLLSHLDSVRLDEAAAQIHDEITSLPRENRRWIFGRPPADEFYGLCDDPDVRVHDDGGGHLTPTVATCGVKLFGPADAKRIDCPACGASYSRAERHASMLAELVEHLGTVRQVAATLTSLGRPVTIKQLTNWMSRGLVASRGGVPRLVRVGDVLDCRDAMAERAARRSQKRERMSA